MHAVKRGSTPGGTESTLNTKSSFLALQRLQGALALTVILLAGGRPTVWRHCG